MEIGGIGDIGRLQGEFSLAACRGLLGRIVAKTRARDAVQRRAAMCGTLSKRVMRGALRPAADAQPVAEKMGCRTSRAWRRCALQDWTALRKTERRGSETGVLTWAITHYGSHLPFHGAFG
jgi:hypothetical protein